MRLVYCTICGRRGLVSKASIYTSLCPHCMTPTLRVATAEPPRDQQPPVTNGGETRGTES